MRAGNGVEGGARLKRSGLESPLRRAARLRKRTLLDVGRVLGRRLKKGNAALVGKGFCLVKLDLPLAVHVALVSDEQLVDVLARVLVDLIQPLLDIVEALAVRDVVHDDDAVRAAVVARRDCAKALLPRSVPLRARRRRGEGGGGA